MDKRKTIICKSTDNLNKDIAKELLREKTQDLLNESQILVFPTQQKAGNSHIGDHYHLKKDIAQSSNRMMNFVMKSPIASTNDNLNLSSISRHERTPSFINKLPVDLKNCLLIDLDAKSNSNILNIGDNHLSDHEESESSQSIQDEDTESESSVSDKKSNERTENDANPTN